MLPLPVFDTFETPFEVAQLAMLEQRAAIRLLRTADKVPRTVHFHRNLLPMIQSHERIDAVPGLLFRIRISPRGRFILIIRPYLVPGVTR